MSAKRRSMNSMLSFLMVSRTFSAVMAGSEWVDGRKVQVTCQLRSPYDSMICRDAEVYSHYFGSTAAPLWSRSTQLRAQRHRLVGHAQGDIAIRIVEARDQAFGHQGTDLFLRKVDYAHHQLADQLFRLVQRGDLRAGFPDADVGTEIDLQHVSGLARFGEHPRVDAAAHPQFDAGEVVPSDRFHATPPEPAYYPAT